MKEHQSVFELPFISVNVRMTSRKSFALTVPIISDKKYNSMIPIKCFCRFGLKIVKTLVAVLYGAEGTRKCAKI